MLGEIISLLPWGALKRFRSSSPVKIPQRVLPTCTICLFLSFAPVLSVHGVLSKCITIYVFLLCVMLTTDLVGSTFQLARILDVWGLKIEMKPKWNVLDTCCQWKKKKTPTTRYFVRWTFAKRNRNFRYLSGKNKCGLMLKTYASLIEESIEIFPNL